MCSISLSLSHLTLYNTLEGTEQNIEEIMQCRMQAMAMLSFSDLYLNPLCITCSSNCLRV